jgi:hypothetical protein
LQFEPYWYFFDNGEAMEQFTTLKSMVFYCDLYFTNLEIRVRFARLVSALLVEKLLFKRSL